MSNIRVGNKVKFIDGSYTMSILNGSKKLSKQYLGLDKREHTVIAINVPCPNDPENFLEILRPANNCIIASDNGDIHFCSIVNIKKIKKNKVISQH